MKNRWIAISALACALSAIAIAQPPAPDAGITGIAHIAFRVSDLDREIAFLGKLGYEESFAITNNGKTTEVFVKINDRQFIELYPQTDASQPLGWMHVCFEAGDLNALVNYYVSIGLKAAPVRKAGAGNLISSMNDPEGRVTEFTQYMPGSRHTLDRGQHLGANRVSTELLGFDIPVNGLAAEKQFYIQLGFESEDNDGSVRLSAPGAPDVRLEMRPVHTGAQPEFLFPVPGARKAADALKETGVKAERDGKLVFVHDPDGNAFVFLETGPAHKESLIPGKHKSE
ncbi:MAG: VOC family protein [Terracidiphilus sp.]|jgi:catechol 2,3-dioxygenase-like lactoylglutathione lyase family enzyme